MKYITLGFAASLFGITVMMVPMAHAQVVPINNDPMILSTKASTFPVNGIVTKASSTVIAPVLITHTAPITPVTTIATTTHVTEIINPTVANPSHTTSIAVFGQPVISHNQNTNHHPTSTTTATVSSLTPIAIASATQVSNAQSGEGQPTDAPGNGSAGNNNNNNNGVINHTVSGKAKSSTKKTSSSTEDYVPSVPTSTVKTYIPLIAQSEMITPREKASTKKTNSSKLGASVRDTGVSVTLTGVLIAVLMILATIVGLRSYEERKRQQMLKEQAMQENQSHVYA
jgi:hypothetical protein